MLQIISVLSKENKLISVLWWSEGFECEVCERWLLRVET
jgi:hypothetical protein